MVLDWIVRLVDGSRSYHKGRVGAEFCTCIIVIALRTHPTDLFVVVAWSSACLWCFALILEYWTLILVWWGLWSNVLRYCWRIIYKSASWKGKCLGLLSRRVQRKETVAKMQELLRWAHFKTPSLNRVVWLFFTWYRVEIKSFYFDCKFDSLSVSERNSQEEGCLLLLV